jgi:2'-hydroxyisoflavone reductase
VTPTRREFLKAAGVAGAGLALGGTTGCRDETESGAAPVATSTPTPKKLLILGGTGFIGPHMVRYALGRGHEVTIFTRGRAETEVPSAVEHLLGDRNDDHTALEGRTWDIVLDNNARDYRWVQKSTALLEDAVEQYVFVSTASVYADESMGWENAGNVLLAPIVDENSARVEAPEGWKEGDEAPYGFTKTLSENIAHATFPGRTTVVRPGLIVGPGDPTDRFTYWPLRLDEGGEILAPGNPEHANQIIDQRDLTEWIVRLAENGTMGNFNGAGPADRLSMRSMLEQVGSVASNPYELTWITETFLQEQGVRPWSDMPAWLPGDPASFVDVRTSIRAGLTYRPLPVTARDTLEWDKTRPTEQRGNRRAGMSRESEREVLDAWHASR